MMEQPPLLPEEMQAPPREKTHCRRCAAEVFFSRTDKGRQGIFNWEPDPNGNIVLDRNGVAHYLGKDQPNETAGPRYVSHFATCPFASEFRA